MVFDSHEQAGTAPKSSLNLQVPRVPLPAPFHGDPFTAKAAFNAFQPRSRSLPTFRPDRHSAWHRYGKAGRNAASPNVEAMPESAIKSRRRLKYVQECGQDS